MNHKARGKQFFPDLRTERKRRCNGKRFGESLDWPSTGLSLGIGQRLLLRTKTEAHDYRRWILFCRKLDLLRKFISSVKVFMLAPFSPTTDKNFIRRLALDGCIEVVWWTCMVVWSYDIPFECHPNKRCVLAILRFWKVRLSTGIDAIRTTDVQFNDDNWYTLDGRCLSVSSITKGVYIYHHKKVVIK